jgi:hypothetical protein
MSIKFAILALLAEKPRHGYEIDNPAIGGLLSTVTQPVTLKTVQRCVNLSNVQGPGMICAPG